MCHSMSGKSKDLATSSASIVLPVPGSPFINKGLSKAIAAFTERLKSSVAMYDFVPLNFMYFPYLYNFLRIYDNNIL